VAPLDLIAISSVGPWQLLGIEHSMLEAVASGETRPLVLAYAMAGRMVSLGRYHLYDGPAERAGVGAWRRLTGGRVVGSGQGWFGLALMLPSRTALLPERNAHLRPEQVINRYVRGLLRALRALDLDCFYPGRDAVTVGRREIAMCSLESDASGATLFEAVVAIMRGMEHVVHDLERFDPDGLISCPMYGPATASMVVHELGRDVTFHEFCERIARGYAELLGGVNRRELSPVETGRAQRRALALESSRWLCALAPDPELTAISRTTSQLGSVQARLRLGPGGLIERIQLSGDFIANSAGIRALESELVGRPLDPASVSSAVMKTLADPDNFILGMGEPGNLVKLISAAQ
jgi:lipoate-protein ligase A